VTTSSAGIGMAGWTAGWFEVLDRLNNRVDVLIVSEGIDALVNRLSAGSGHKNDGAGRSPCQNKRALDRGRSRP